MKKVRSHHATNHRDYSFAQQIEEALIA